MELDDCPLVSIITPSFNHARYIRQTIESVLAQDYPRVEHIVVDGGSTDGTVAILREYGARYPDRFRWVSEPDRGQSHAFNKGLATARGEFIGWQNSDDYYFPNAFCEPMAYLTSHPEVAVVYGDCAMVDDQGTTLRIWRGQPFKLEAGLGGGSLPNQAAFARRATLVECGGLNEDFHYAMDYDLWLRIALRSPLVYLPGLRGAFRMHEQAKTVQGLARNRLETSSLIASAIADPRFPDQLKPFARDLAMRYRCSAAWHFLVMGDVQEATALLTQLLAGDARAAEVALRHLLLAALVQEFQGFGTTGGPDAAAPRSAFDRLQATLGEAGRLDRKQTRWVQAVAHLLDALYGSPSFAARSAHVVLAVARDPLVVRYTGTWSLLSRALLGVTITRKVSTVRSHYRARETALRRRRAAEGTTP